MKRGKLKRVLTAFVGVIAAAGVLAGCGADFDASGYMKACLDANVHGEFAEYAKLTATEESDLKSQHDAIIDQELAMLDMLGIGEEQKAEFRDLFVNLYAKCKYEVGEAVKNEDNTYTVPVTVYRLKAFQSLTTDAQTHMQDFYDSEAAAGNEPTTEDLYAEMANYMYDGLSANIESPQYDEAEVIEVEVGPSATDSRVYQVTQDDLQELLYAMTDATQQ